MMRTIGGLVDSGIGENPISRADRRLKKFTSNLAEARVIDAMNTNGDTPRSRHVVDYAAAAIEQMDLYCTAHSGSPSAVRRPQLFFRSDLWIALLGPTIEEGIVGIGPTVAAALRAFDMQYQIRLRPPNEEINLPMKAQQSFTVNLHRRPDCRKLRT
jgi:hypothetical protein